MFHFHIEKLFMFSDIRNIKKSTQKYIILSKSASIFYPLF